ncbi:Arc family DNA-binding protein [Mesorhizobium sp. BR1-1-12]|uniref:Arc family DNA-binding protein n=1 Tax=unclassified Mesorhizobium TaxID=325217 RepID=UPI001CC9F699|nr:MULTISPECIES: Arc family DNA-binding protein [unclassified Mesorhizobium]MBZ9919116.1 Arc family DNA-binding protein [Mesorhizobium sp. BR1-1-7]MBZ9970105.1 Arc family DNA-binding protein [Mesorhizobium sp. BR1-1-12]
MTKESPQPEDKYVLRMPDGLRDRIKAAAELNKRSMNAEMVATLEEKYPAPVDFDQEAFMEKWINPILEDDASDHRRHQKLIRAADEAAKRIHPNLGVWESLIGNRFVVTFGIRDQSLVPPEVRSFLQSIITVRK